MLFTTKSIGVPDVAKRPQAALMPNQLSLYLNTGDNWTVVSFALHVKPQRGENRICLELFSWAEWGRPLHSAGQQMLRRLTSKAAHLIHQTQHEKWVEDVNKYHYSTFLKERFAPKWKFCHHLLSSMLMESRVKVCSQQYSVVAFSLTTKEAGDLL